MRKSSPYFVETQLGKLELMKGQYLAMNKRNNPSCQTLIKSKTITHAKFNNKPTLKKQMNVLRQTIRVYSKQEQQKYPVYPDCRLFTQENQRGRVDRCSTLPSMDIEYDNDCESEWNQIHYSVENMSMSLSMAVYDQRYG